MQIFVKPYYRTLTLDVRPTDTVAVVKSMIRTKLSGEETIPTYKMSLAYAGKPLARDDRTLADCGVGNLARLTFGINMSGKRPTAQGPHLLCVQYPAERKAFSSDCFYEVELDTTVRDLTRMVLAREGFIVTRIFDGPYDELRIGNVPLEDILRSHAAGNTVPTLRVAQYSRRARASRTVTRLATDLVREVLSYSDFGTLAAGAATCRALLEAVPPKLAHELVLARFPILTTIVDASKAMPPARELFESQEMLFGAPPPAVLPSRGLDEYVLSLELTVDGSKHVGTGVVQDDAGEAQICFTGIPKALWDEAATIEDRITANIMATRRGTLRRAALYSGDIEDIIPPAICFEWNRIPCENSAMGWISAGGGPHNVYYTPLICVEWKAPAAAAAETELTATFKWDSDDQARDMSLEDACLMLEHWCKL